jgi:Ca-activated chloride channel homolog
MNFLSPMAFWFAAAIPVVVLFYLLKRRRVVQLVSSTLLWQKFLAETQASAPFQKLRHNWLLVLQVLLLLLVIFALARPYFSGKTVGGRMLVVILDASASMQSTDETPSRFEKARREALQMVDSMHDKDQMVILQAAAHTEVKQSPTSEKGALRRALQNSRPVDTGTRLTEALKLAENLIQNNRRAEIHLFSDGAVPNLEEFENSALPLVFHQVGQRADNLGITSIDARPHPEDPSQRAVFVNVANFSTNAMESGLEFRFNGQLLDFRTVKLPARENAPQIFFATQQENGVFSVKLTAKDDLEVDNEAAIASLLPQPLRVLLVTPGNQFLVKAIRAIPHVELKATGFLNEAADEFDLVILDNVTPAVWPSGNVLAFRAARPDWFQTTGILNAPAIVDWKSSHPLLRFVNFDNVLIAESLAVTTPPWAVTLVESPQSGLIFAGELGRQRIVWVGFDSVQSTWPLRLSFPIFMANALEWLNPASANAEQLTVRAGHPVRIGLDADVDTVELTLPDGTVRPWSFNRERGEFLYGETMKQGVYRVRAGSEETFFCVNLMDSLESDITPKSELQLGRFTQEAAVPIRQASVEIWRWIAALGLLVLLFEWWFYHRRTV